MKLLKIILPIILFLVVVSSFYFYWRVAGDSYWYSVIPSFLAVASVFIIKNVIFCLLMSFMIGSLVLLFTGNGAGIIEILNKTIINYDNIEIFLMVAFFLSFVSVLLSTEGFENLIERLQKKVTKRSSAGLLTYVLGLMIFIDGYANALIVGGVTRTLGEKYRISKEKMAFIVDATAAPISGIVIFSTWIAFEVGLFEQMSTSLGMGMTGFEMFVQAIPYRFYCLLMLIFVPLNLIMGREIGPMYRAEVQAINSEQKADQQEVGASRDDHLYLVAVLPIIMLMLVMTVGILVWGMSVAMTSLFISSICALLFSIFLGKVLAKKSMPELVTAALNGFKKSMLPIIIILLAWLLKGVCSELGTGQYLTEVFGDYLNGWSFPAIVFIISSLIAFSIGTSWGTMSILIPLLVPLAYSLDQGVFGITTILTLAAILDGAVFGDHSSPISDTTIMSSIATGCDHIAHVKTQVVYAVIVGFVALVFGYILQGLGIALPISFSLAVVILLIICLLGKKVRVEN